METKTNTQIETESDPEVGSERQSIEKLSDSKENENEKIEDQINNKNNGHTFGSAKLSDEALYNENSEDRVNSSGPLLMGVGQGVGDDAADVAYSTKPDNHFNTNSTLYTTTEFNGNLMETDGRMNINSTEQNKNFDLNNSASIPLTMTQYVDNARESIEIDNNSIDRGSAIGNACRS